MESPQVQQLILEEDQVSNLDRLQTILDSSFVTLNNSEAGTGKTPVTLAMALESGLSVGVVCPVSVKAVWIELSNKYGVPLEFNMSYDTLRGRVGTRLSHNLLTRHTVKIEGKNHHTFKVTNEFKSLVEKGLLFVIDECHSVKNNETIQFTASMAMTKFIIEHNSRKDLHSSKKQSRVVLLSATPLDKDENIASLLSLLGLTEGKLYTTKGNTFSLCPAFNTFIKRCEALDKEKTVEICKDMPSSAEELPIFLAELLGKVVSPALFDSMPSVISGVERDFCNGFYNTNVETYNKLKAAVEELRRATGFKDDKVATNAKSLKAMGKVTKALQEIEILMHAVFTRLALDHLSKCDKEGNKGRVIIALHFVEESLHPLRELLSGTGYGMEFPEYGTDRPLILTGNESEAERAQVIRLFKTGKTRILLLQINAGGQGVNLHDEVGDAPTLMLISPGYGLIPMHQAACRIYRRGTKSKASVRIVFGKGEACTQSILVALQRKRDVLSLTLNAESREKRIYPDQYPRYEEESLNEGQL